MPKPKRTDPHLAQKKIRALRLKIDGLDRSIANALAKRVSIAKQIHQIKRTAGAGLHDLQREKEIFMMYWKALRHVSSPKKVKALTHAAIELTPSYRRKTKAKTGVHEGTISPGTSSRSDKIGLSDL